ncbi:MAG: hypothetical protein MZV64_10135 [Ignavibacteriales bacterium]|nr:hypothetical protein [Ignavibacteriales bacterium]
MPPTSIAGSITTVDAISRRLTQHDAIGEKPRLRCGGDERPAAGPGDRLPTLSAPLRGPAGRRAVSVAQPHARRS